MAIRLYNNRQDFITAIKRLLSSPVINLEVHEDTFNTVIDLALWEFRKLIVPDGSYLTYMVFPVTSGTSAISTSGLNIQNVVEFRTMNGLANINTIFTNEHVLLCNQDGSPRVWGNTGGSTSVGLDLSSFEGFMQNLKLITQMLSKEYTISLRHNEEILNIFPQPKTDIFAGIMCYVYESELNILNNPLFVKLVKAKIKVIWGEALDKYNSVLSGGGTANGARIISEALQEEKEAYEEIRGESYPCDFSSY